MKGRCWCCWETSETLQNPLIRVCSGCKDIDLQHVHQSCIDQYLNSNSNIQPQCTRCLDQFNVAIHRTSLLTSVSNDRVLAPCLITMAVSSAIAASIAGYCVGVIFWRNIWFEPGHALVSLTTTVLVLAVLCVLLFVSSLVLVKSHFRYAVRRSALPI